MKQLLFCLALVITTLALHGQTDTISKTKKEKQTNNQLPKKTSTKEKKNIPPDEKKGLETVTEQRNNSIDTITEYKEKIKLLEDKLDELKSSNEQLKQEIEDLKKENKSLSSQSQQSKEKENNKSFSFLKTAKNILTITLAAIGILALWIYFLKRKSKKKKTFSRNLPIHNNQNKPITNIQAIAEEHRNKLKETQNKLNETTKPTIILTKELSFSNISTKSFDVNTKKDKWYIVGSSSTGRSHLAANKPCQDNHYSEYWENGWGIAITADGAGSAEFSHYGSQFVATVSALNNFKNLVLKNKWHNRNYLPSSEEWTKQSFQALKKVYNELEDFASENKYPLNSVACTIIVIIFSPIGLLVTHIGDGRAGYCIENGEWKPAITPHKGEESNLTIFITSNAWNSDSQLTMSNVLVPESRVIEEKIFAFTLMSDGCEAHSFECSSMNTETNKWNDPNKPYAKFFDPICNQLKSMYTSNISLIEANNKWKQFLENGNSGLKEESDDKTMIIGVLI